MSQPSQFLTLYTFITSAPNSGAGLVTSLLFQHPCHPRLHIPILSKASWTAPRPATPPPANCTRCIAHQQRGEGGACLAELGSLCFYACKGGQWAGAKGGSGRVQGEVTIEVGVFASERGGPGARGVYKVAENITIMRWSNDGKNKMQQLDPTNQNVVTTTEKAGVNLTS